MNKNIYTGTTMKIDGGMLLPECIYNPITLMKFSALFTFELGNTKR